MEPLTPIASPTTIFSPFAPARIAAAPLQASLAKELLSGMATAIDSLGDIFGDLQNETMKVALHGDKDVTPQIQKLRRQMEEQDQIHMEGVAEIKLILNKYLETEIFEHLKLQAQQEIEQEIDELVREEVAKHLQELIAPKLQDEVAMYNRELEEYRVKLHNSESRRANAALRSNQPDDSLREIYMSSGKVSSSYPKSLKELFNLDGESCKTLMLDYELPDVSEARDRNLNRFLQFCGVTYQMVRTGAGTHRVGVEQAAAGA